MAWDKVSPTSPAIVIGEVMAELSGIRGEPGRRDCKIGVAGDTYNTSVYLARAGVPVAYTTCLGDDPFSDDILHVLAEEGMDTSCVLREPGGVAGLYAVKLDDHGERSFTYWRSQSPVRRLFQRPDISTITARIESAPFLYFSGITLSLFSADERTRLAELARTVAASGGIVAFDTNYRPRGWSSAEEAREAVGLVAPHVTLALPTFDDEKILYGFERPEDSAEFWARQGAGEVVVKHGADGAFLAGAGWIRPPEAIVPKDTTGAGDSFNGGYLAGRFTGRSPEESALAGHRLAGQVLMHFGAILPIELPR